MRPDQVERDRLGIEAEFPADDEEKARMWQPISSAPRGSNLELSDIEHDVTHVLSFPCRRGPPRPRGG
jgi:hypothetical protein